MDNTFFQFSITTYGDRNKDGRYAVSCRDTYICTSLNKALELYEARKGLYIKHGIGGAFYINPMLECNGVLMEDGCRYIRRLLIYADEGYYIENDGTNCNLVEF